MNVVSKSAVFAMIGSAACWGATTTVSKWLLETAAPLPLLFLQLVCSVLFLFVVELWSNGRQPIFAKRACLGILEPGVAYLLNLYGLASTSAGHASLICAIEPILVLPIAVLLLRERCRLATVCWSILCAVGVVVLSIVDQQAAGSASLAGDLLIFCGVGSASIYVVSSKFFVSDRPAVVQARQQQLVGLLFITGAVLLVSDRAELYSLTQLPWSTLAAIAASGVVQYGIAFWLYLYAIKKLSAGTAASFLNLIPVFGISSAFLCLGEPLSWSMGIGTLAIILGVNQIHSRSAANAGTLG